MSTVAGFRQREKLVNIQVLRFVAAALVVYAHAVDLSQIASGTSFLAYGNLENFGAIGVDLFFVISGFIITKTAFLDKEMAAQDFLRRRILRVAPIYFLLSTPWLAWSLSHGLDLSKLIATYLFFPAAGATMATPVLPLGWTLCFEMLFYTGTALFISLGPRVGLSAVALVFTVSWFLSLQTALPLFQFLGNPIILEFALGIAAALVYSSIPRWLGTVLGVIGVAWITSTLVLGFGQISESGDIIDGSLSLQRFFYWGLPSGLVVIFALSRKNDGRLLTSRFGGLLVQLGDASYSIYLVHPTLFVFLKKTLLTLPLQPDVVIAIAVLGGIASGLFVYNFVELPLTQKLHRRYVSA
ncbi:acyltransferase family protein [Rhizobium sp. Rhizsp82]|uniref:acyltransferase family protein n=1 Tax=Rhizobium sp. Rhizsp82 TaxID=3243057 RepID=UPI0039B64562